jgi:hypothetical protein
MATTGVDFVLIKKVATQIKGTTVQATPYVQALDPIAAKNIADRVPGGAGSGLSSTGGLLNNGNFLIDGFAYQGFAKNGVYHKTTSGTTGVTIDLTDLTSGATSYDGDTTFATVNQITFYNTGAADMTIAPGASNPSNIPKFTGTTPTLALPAGSTVTLKYPAGVTIDSTHKTILITPTAGGDVFVGVGGA